MEKNYRYFLSESATDGEDKDDADEIVTIEQFTSTVICNFKLF